MRIGHMLFAIFFSVSSLALGSPSLNATDLNTTKGDYPEANPFNAFNAPISQQIEVDNPLFLWNLVQPLIRVTITLYMNDAGEPSTGFVAVTHNGHRDLGNVTYYYQTIPSNENEEMVTMHVGEPWGSALSDVVPKKDTDFVSNKNIFAELPYEAKQLWLLMPRSFIVKEVGGHQGFLFLTLYGDEDFGGLISWPVASARYYSEIQNEQKVFIWALEGIGVPDSVRWSTRGSGGIFEWKPGYSEPKFIENGIDA